MQNNKIFFNKILGKMVVTKEGKRLGFEAVESGPLVRSSYHAEKHVKID